MSNDRPSEQPNDAPRGLGCNAVVILKGCGMQDMNALRARLQVACSDFVKASGSRENDPDELAMRMMHGACREFDYARRGELLAEACSALNGFRSLFDEHDPEANRILAACKPHIAK